MVTIGESQGGKTQILSGLQPGDKIVGDGSLFLQISELVATLSQGPKHHDSSFRSIRSPPTLSGPDAGRVL